MAVRDLVCDVEYPERWSHTKVWSNIGYLTATIMFAKIGWYAAPTDSLSMLFLVYLGIVAGSPIANKFISNKWGGVTGNGSPTSPATPAPPAVK